MSEPSPTNPNPSKPDHYELEPADPTPARPPLTPKLDAPGLTDDFDEDADFDHDPAMSPGVPKAPRPAAAPTDVFVKPGLGSAQVIGTLGVVAYLGAAIYAAAVAPSTVHLGWLRALVLGLHQGGLQTLAGIAAVVFAARMAEKPLGSLELAAARMLLAVSLARVLLPLPIPVPYVGEIIRGLAVFGMYAAVTFVLFRVNKHHWLVMVAGHAVLAIVLYFSGAIETWSRDAEAVRPV